MVTKSKKPVSKQEPSKEDEWLGPGIEEDTFETSSYYPSVANGYLNWEEYSEDEKEKLLYLSHCIWNNRSIDEIDSLQRAFSGSWYYSIAWLHIEKKTTHAVIRGYSFMEIASEMGWHCATADIADACFRGIYYSVCLGATIYDYQDFRPESDIGMEYLLRAAEQGFIPAQFKLHEIYKQGEFATISDTKAFLWLKKAAYNRYVDAYPKLVMEYENGMFRKLEEAYIWALISNTSSAFSNDRTAPSRLEKSLDDTKIIVELQNEASRRHDILKTRALTDEDVAQFYVTFTINKEHHVNNTNPQGKTESNEIVSPLTDSDDAEHDDGIELSNVTEYRYASTVKKNFDISKVELELEIGRKLTKNEAPDYNKLKIIYNGKYTDRKLAKMYESIRVNQKSRQLLLCLACQTSIKDEEKQNANIKAILSKAKSDTSSRLNTMLKTMFPKCGLSNKCCMINMAKGLVFVKLSIKDPLNMWDSDICVKCQYLP